MALTDTGIRQLKHSGAKAGDKISDGGGMYLLATATAKCWRMNYRFDGKQKTLALGVYPAVSDDAQAAELWDGDLGEFVKAPAKATRRDARTPAGSTLATWSTYGMRLDLRR